MDDMTTLPAGLKRVGSVWQLRIGIPIDVRPLWPRLRNGQMATDAYRASLRTSDRSEAIAKAHALIADYHRQFQSLRDTIRAPRPASVTPGLAKYIEQEARRMILQAEEHVRDHGDAHVLGATTMHPCCR